MANQAIALQSRVPQTNFMGRAIQQNAQLINMMSRQRADERQAAQVAQAMKIARAKESREISAAEIDMAGKKFDFYTKRAGQTMTPEGYSLLLKGLDTDAPELATIFRANLPEANFDRNTMLQMVGSLSDNFNARYGSLKTQVVQLKNGDYAVARTGGFGTPGVFELEEFKLAPHDAPAAQTPTSAFPTTAAPATDAQINETPRNMLRGAGVGELGIGVEDFDGAPARANELSAGGGARMQPISMTTGGQMGGQPDMKAVLRDMMSSRQISQSNLQRMREMVREMAGPDKDAQLAQILKADNIQIVPDAQPQMRSAVFRPGEDAAPQMQLAQSMEDYRPTGRPARGKEPRETAEEVYGKEFAREKAMRDVAEGQPKPLTRAEEGELRRNMAKDYRAAQSTIDLMLDPTAGVVAAVRSVRSLSPSQKEAITGLSGYAPSLLPDSRQADTKMGNLIGKVTQLGKQAASLDGAIGQMAVQEWTIVRDMIAALDLTGMEAADLDDQLNIIEAQAIRTTEVVRRAYEDQYAEEFQRYGDRFRLTTPPPRQKTQTSTEARLPRVRSDAEFDRFAPGTLFIDPNGQTRRKP